MADASSNVNTNVTTNLTFNQLATVMGTIYGLATGSGTYNAAVNTADFISQAQHVLRKGYDPLIGAISQVLSRTIFSIRPYSAKFTEIRWDSRKWGNAVRKINFADGDFEDDSRLPLTDGSSVDMFAVKKPKVFETQWFNNNVYQKHYTIFRDQLDVAFSGPDEFQRFLTGVTTNVSDMLEQSREEFARSIIANYIGALYAQGTGQTPRDSGRVIKLCTQFCTEMGISTGQQGDTYSTPRDAAFADANYDKFMKWLFAKIAIISKLFTERSQLFQSLVYETSNNVDTLIPIMRHTPYENQRMYLFVDVLKNIDTRVLSAAFHDNYLKIGKHNTVSYWQSIKEGSYTTGSGQNEVTHNLGRDSVYVIPSTIDKNGVYNTNPSAVDVPHVFGILFDENALAMTQGSTWSAPTPFNAKGGYSNIFFHETVMGMNDMTEKGVLLLLD